MPGSAPVVSKCRIAVSPGLTPDGTVEDSGNVSVAIAETKKHGDPNAKYLKEITSTCQKEAELVIKALEAGEVPFIIGGDAREYAAELRRFADTVEATIESIEQHAKVR